MPKVMIFNKSGSDYNVTDKVRLGDRESGGPFDMSELSEGTIHMISRGLLDSTPFIEEKKKAKDNPKEDK